MLRSVFSLLKTNKSRSCLNSINSSNDASNTERQDEIQGTLVDGVMQHTVMGNITVSGIPQTFLKVHLLNVAEQAVPGVGMAPGCAVIGFDQQQIALTFSPSPSRGLFFFPFPRKP